MRRSVRSELYAPLTGTIIDVNDELDAAPEKINSDPYGAGWMVKVTMADPSQLDALLSADEYEAFVADEA